MLTFGLCMSILKVVTLVCRDLNFVGFFTFFVQFFCVRVNFYTFCISVREGRRGSLTHPLPPVERNHHRRVPEIQPVSPKGGSRFLFLVVFLDFAFTM